jgi:cytochrome c oxidase subunit IV
MAVMPLVIFIALAVIAAVLFHYFIRQYLVASILAGPISCLVFLVIGRILEGHFDKFLPIAFFFGTGYAIGIALVVGIPFLAYRAVKEKN